MKNLCYERNHWVEQILLLSPRTSHPNNDGRLLSK